MQVREFEHGQSVAEVMLVRGAELRRRRDGDEFLRLNLGDRSANVTAIVSDGLAEALELCRVGVAVWVAGRFEVHERFGPQLAVDSIRAAKEDEYDTADLLDGPARSAGQMESDL